MEEINTSKPTDEGNEIKDIINNEDNKNIKDIKDKNENENNILEKYIICPICKCELNKPLECTSCHKIFCELCINNYIKKNKTCPSNCEKVILTSNRVMSNIIDELIKIKSFKDFKEKTIKPTPKTNNQDNKINKTDNNENQNNQVIDINSNYLEQNEKKNDEKNQKVPLVEDINKYDYKLRFEDLFKEFSKFKTEFNKVNDENVKLRKDNWDLKTENITLQRRKDELVEEFDELNKKIEINKGVKNLNNLDFKKLTKKNKVNVLDKYTIDIDKLNNEVQSLKKTESEYRKNNEKLKKENEKLKFEVERLREEIGYIEDRYQDDDDEIDSKKKRTEWY